MLRVEIFRDWGFNNFGLYTLPPSSPALQITSIDGLDGNITIHWNGTGPNFSGLQKAVSLNPIQWNDVPGTIGKTNHTTTSTGEASFYRARKF